MLPVLLAFASTFFFAGQSLCGKQGLAEETTPFTCTVVNLSATAVFLWIATLLWESPDLLRTPYVWLFAGLGILVPGLARHLFFIGVHHIGPSRSSVLGGVTPLLSSFAAIVFFGEPFRLQTSLGTIAIVVGIFLISFERDARLTFEKRYLLFPLGAAVFWAVRDNFVRLGLKATQSPLTAAAVSVSSAALFFLALSLCSSPSTRIALNRRSFGYFVLSGFFGALAYMLTFFAFNLGNVIRAGPAIYSTGLATILLSLIFMRKLEIITPRVVAAGLVILAGVALISLD